MDKLKQYVVLAVLGSLVVLAAGWFLLVSPKRSDADALKAKTTTQESTNAQLATQLQVLKAQAKDLPRQQAKLAAVAAKIPDTQALPSLIRALTTASTSSGVELVSVAPGAPVLVAAAPAGVTQGAAPAAAAPAGSAAGQLASLPVTLSVVGGYFQMQEFMSALENLPRSMRVTNLALSPGASPVKPLAAGVTVDDGRSLTAAISAQVFMAANRPAATAAVLPGVPTAPTGTGAAGAPAAPAN